jgi:hypothetical protein
MRTSETINELATALAKAQAKIEAAPKDTNNPFFNKKYADLASVWSACRVPLTENGLSVVQTADSEAGVVGITTRLLHTSGQWIEGTLKLAPTKNDPQGFGSAITYGRRYGLSAIVGIVADDDDDGNAASGPAVNAKEKPAAKSPPKAPPAAKAESPAQSPEQLAFNEWAKPLVAKGELQRDEVARRLKESNNNYAQVRADIEAALAELTPAKV